MMLKTMRKIVLTQRSDCENITAFFMSAEEIKSLNQSLVLVFSFSQRRIIHAQHRESPQIEHEKKKKLTMKQYMFNIVVLPVGGGRLRFGVAGRTELFSPFFALYCHFFFFLN